MSKYTISASDGKNQRLDKFLSVYISKSSRSTIKKMINEGLVFVNGETTKPSFILDGSEKISYDLIEEKEKSENLTPQDIDLEIIYEDNDIVAINKPAGITVHPGAGQNDGTIANALVFRFNSLSNVNGTIRPGIVHRLDKDTSGVMLVAKNNNAHANLSNQFEMRSINKEYKAITWGLFSDEKGEINSSIARSKRDPTSYIIDSNGRNAHTSYVSKALGSFASEVVFHPKTGRTHQIRVHSSSIGNPIFGDNKYGGGKNKSKGYLPEVSKILENLLKKIDRQALHAKSITFTHPSSKKTKTIAAEIPNEIKILKKELASLYA